MHRGIRKINCQYRIRHYLSTTQMQNLANAYILSSFRYASLIWMFTTSAAISQINKTHKRCLKAIFVHNSCDVYTFDQLLSLDSSITMHEMHLRSLLIEVYKALNELNPKFIAEFFTVKD